MDKMLLHNSLEYNKYLIYGLKRVCYSVDFPTGKAIPWRVQTSENTLFGPP